MREILTASLLALAALGAAQSYRWDFDSTIPDNDPTTGTLLQTSGDPGGLLTVNAGANQRYVASEPVYPQDLSALRLGWDGTAGSSTTPILSITVPTLPTTDRIFFDMSFREGGALPYATAAEIKIDGMSAGVAQVDGVDAFSPFPTSPLVPTGRTTATVDLYLYSYFGTPFTPGTGVDIDSITVRAVPEPAPFAALGLGAAAVLARRRRRA